MTIPIKNLVDKYNNHLHDLIGSKLDIQEYCDNVFKKIFPDLPEGAIQIDKDCFDFLDVRHIIYSFELKHFGFKTYLCKFIELPYDLFETPEKLKQFILKEINEN